MKLDIKLGDKDSAIIFKEDGEIELCLPKIEEDGDATPSSVKVAHLALAMKDEEIMGLISDKFDKAVASIK